MKILHIIDEAYFKTHNRIIEELLFALYSQGIEQKVYTSMGANLGKVSSGKFPMEWWRVKRSGKIRTFRNKIRTMLLMSSFRPDIVIKWGRDARLIAWGAGGVQVSYINEKESLVNFENTDYVMTNSDDVLSFVKSNGFSGLRSFIVPPMLLESKKGADGMSAGTGSGSVAGTAGAVDVVGIDTVGVVGATGAGMAGMYGMAGKRPLGRRDFFIPEKAKVVFVGSSFRREIGFENAFEVLGSVSERYFFIAGSGPDKEYVEDLALRYNVKARSRFVADASLEMDVLAMSEVAFLPFRDAQVHKYILEAMISKVPVVTVKNSVTEEFIRDGKTGFFVPVRDMYLIKKKFKEVLSLSDEERQKVVDAGYEVAKEYLASQVIGAYIQIFRELLRRYSSRRNLLN